jgi:hypothetical protein
MRTFVTARRTIRRDEEQPSAKRVKLEEDMLSPLLGSSCVLYHKESLELFVRQQDKTIQPLSLAIKMPEVLAVYDNHENEFHSILTRSRVWFFFDDNNPNKSYNTDLLDNIPEGVRVDDFQADFDFDLDFGFAYRFTDCEGKEDRRASLVVNMFYSTCSHLEAKLEHVIVDVEESRGLNAVKLEEGVLVVVLQNKNTMLDEFMLFNADNVLQGVIGLQRDDDQHKKSRDFEFELQVTKGENKLELASAQITSVVVSTKLEF